MASERWVIPVCVRCGKVLIPTAISGWCHCAENRIGFATGGPSGSYREVEVIPLSLLEEIAEELSRIHDRAQKNIHSSGFIADRELAPLLDLIRSRLSDSREDG